MIADTYKSLRVRISGRVQGVFFRAWTKERADELGVFGWVRNRKDGSVEALFTGSAEQVDALIEACRNGPSNARVDHVEFQQAEGVTPERFDIKPTV